MADETFNLPLVQGQSYGLRLRWMVDAVQQPLAAYTPYAQVRAREDVNAALLLDLTPHLTIEDDWIVLRLDGDVTGDLQYSDFKRGRSSWDLMLVETANPGNRVRLVQGIVTLEPAATEVPE